MAYPNPVTVSGQPGSRNGLPTEKVNVAVWEMVFLFLLREVSLEIVKLLFFPHDLAFTSLWLLMLFLSIVKIKLVEKMKVVDALSDVVQPFFSFDPLIIYITFFLSEALFYTYFEP